MVNFSDLVEAGTALARSLGHHPTCPKASRAIPCVCVAGTEQAKALDDWQHLMNEKPLSDTAEILADWEKARNGGISFKDFADKWMPYLEEDLT